jgi:hypothetical protein
VPNIPPTNKDTSALHEAVFDQWKDLVLSRQAIQDRLGKDSIETLRASFDDLTAKTNRYDELLKEQAAPLREILGTSFLGAEEWHQAFGVSIRPPPIPAALNQELLNSPCSLHPGELVKNTHALLLMPSFIGGQPFTALELDRISSAATKNKPPLLQPADPKMDWRYYEPWAAARYERVQWVLIAKSDPDPDMARAHGKGHFRFGLKFQEQNQILKKYYSEDYRVARGLEVMTALVLHRALVGGDSKLISLPQRCEGEATGMCVCVNKFAENGLQVLWISDNGYAVTRWDLGVALARKLPQAET